MTSKKRDKWATKLGIIMAVAGSAVGLGNFLRFPVQATANGGGAFMIPYLISLFLLGIPLMWVEWTVGRYGGGFGHGTAPGIFHTLWEKNRFIKYFGVIGIFGPLIIFVYYSYIESWILGYSFFSLIGKLAKANNPELLSSFLNGYQGLETNSFFSGVWIAYVFFILTFLINIFVIYRGVSRGIEKLNKIAMPILFIFAIILVVKVAILRPNALYPSWNFINGLGFLWNPDFSALKRADVWLAASGQIFFTLSVGIGVILTYASYLSKTDDVALSGLTAVGTNEFAEVILGGTIAIPAAFIFLGPIGAKAVAQGGAFDLSFLTMPLIFTQIPMGMFFAFLWFSMLFLAGVTSSVSLAQPAIAFLEDEFDINRKKAVMIFALVAFILAQPVIFFIKYGVLNEMDFWGGTFCLVLFATVEIILFAWIFGIEKSWEEMHHGADIRIPKIYKFIIKYITPLFLIFILVFWLKQKGLATIMMTNISNPALKKYIFATRFGLILVFVILAVLVKIAWRRKKLRR